jgi:hypothetical protein
MLILQTKIRMLSWGWQQVLSEPAQPLVHKHLLTASHLLPGRVGWSRCSLLHEVAVDCVICTSGWRKLGQELGKKGTILAKSFLFLNDREPGFFLLWLVVVVVVVRRGNVSPAKETFPAFSFQVWLLALAVIIEILRLRVLREFGNPMRGEREVSGVDWFCSGGGRTLA